MYDISGPLEWAWKMIKWIIAILLIVIVLLIYKVYTNSQDESKYIESAKRAEECKRAGDEVVKLSDEVTKNLTELQYVLIPAAVSNAIGQVVRDLNITLTLNDLNAINDIPDSRIITVTLNTGHKYHIGYFDEIGDFHSAIKVKTD